MVYYIKIFKSGFKSRFITVKTIIEKESLEILLSCFTKYNLKVSVASKQEYSDALTIEQAITYLKYFRFIQIVPIETTTNKIMATYWFKPFSLEVNYNAYTFFNNINEKYITEDFIKSYEDVFGEIKICKNGTPYVKGEYQIVKKDNVFQIVKIETKIDYIEKEV